MLLLLLVALVIAARYASATTDVHTWAPTWSGTGVLQTATPSWNYTAACIVRYHNNGTNAWVPGTTTCAKISGPTAAGAQYGLTMQNMAWTSGTIAVNASVTQNVTLGIAVAFVNNANVSPAGNEVWSIVCTGATDNIELHYNPSGVFFCDTSHGTGSVPARTPGNFTADVYRLAFSGTHTGSINLGSGGATSSDVRYLVDLDGDGTYETQGPITTLDANGNGSLPIDPAWAGHNYKLMLVAQTFPGFDGLPPSKVPMNITLESGNFPSNSDISSSSTVSGTQSPPIRSSTVDSSGNVTSDPITVTSATVNGVPTTTYTYPTNSGSSATSITYSGSGTSSVTSQDIRQSAAQEAANAQAIIDAINANTASTGAKLDDVIAGFTASGSSSPTPSPTASPTPSPTPTGAQALTTAMDAAGIPTGPDVSGVGTKPAESEVTVAADSDFWTLQVGTIATMDLNPMHNTNISGVASFIRQLVIFIILYYVLSHNYGESEKFLKFVATTKGSGTLAQRSTLDDAFLGTVINVGIAVAFRLLFMVALPSTLTILSAWSEIADEVGGGDLFWFLGGQDIGANITAHLNVQSSPAIRAALDLLNQFVPVALVINAAMNVFGVKVLRFAIEFAWLSWLKYFPE